MPSSAPPIGPAVLLERGGSLTTRAQIHARAAENAPPSPPKYTATSPPPTSGNSPSVIWSGISPMRNRVTPPKKTVSRM